MDIFGTAVTAGNMILTYLDAYASYSDDARSLYHRFKWDLRLLKEIIKYFEQRQSQSSDSRLSLEDEDILNETAEYLKVLISKASASSTKIQASGFLKRTINQGLWVSRRSDLKELEQELRQWTNRFDIRLLGLPPEVRNIIPAVPIATGDNIPTPLVVESNSRMQQFARLASEAKKQRIAELLRKPPDTLLHEIEEAPDVPRTLCVESQQYILTSRPLPSGINTNSRAFKVFQSDLGELAAALHVLDSGADVCLLKVEYYFYSASAKKFLFVQIPPHPVDEVLTLEDMIERTPYSTMLVKHKTWLPLNQRLQLAKRLSEAVFFLHTAGFVHKNITPTSIISLGRSNVAASARFPYSIGNSYIMGFDMIRSQDGISALEGALNLVRRNRHQKDTIARRNLQVFQHPDRLQLDKSKVKRYIKNYDVYSLGVILLQIGLWEPISTITTIPAKSQS
ncbi:hypothetical protein Hte_010099 [Hypoxylon texense]